MGIPVEICEPWTTPERLCCPDVVTTNCVDGEEVPATYVWTDEELIDIATSLLFKLTCRQFPGHCQIKVRPCGYCDCGRRRCGCGRYVYIDLQDRFPVISVDEVKIDGVVLDASAYRVDDYHRLVRVDGECWPSCNDLTEPDTEAETFSVTYTAGRQPPPELRMAAAELACELKRACNGADCNLPNNITSLSREGVTFNLDQLEAAVTGANTGIGVIDAAIRLYDCQRVKGRISHPYLRGPRGVFPS